MKAPFSASMLLHQGPSDQEIKELEFELKVYIGGTEGSDIERSTNQQLGIIGEDKRFMFNVCAPDRLFTKESLKAAILTKFKRKYGQPSK